MSAPRALRGDNPELFPTRSFRSASQSSDAFSTSGRSITSAMPPANPKPAYIAQAAAEQLVTQELDSPVIVSEAALDLVNGFLDQVLFSLLSTSKSTTLEALRAAVPKLLRPRLGQAALSIAEEELKDYLEDEDIDDLHPTNGTNHSAADFDVELSWKIVRLKCMVYARLGNMEEEDEHEYIEQERLEEHAQNSQLTIAPTPALFLTSVLEFIGEQALCTAVQHAEKRFRTTAVLGNDGQPIGNIVLEGPDMLQLGRDGPLSRLWRSWRRDTRATDGVSSRPETPGFIMSPNTASTPHSRKDSFASPDGVITEETTEAVPSLPNPLPFQSEGVEGDARSTNANKVSDATRQQGVGDPTLQNSQRPSSMVVLSTAFPDPPVTRSSVRLSHTEQNPVQPASNEIGSSGMQPPLQSLNSGVNRTEDGFDLNEKPVPQQLSEQGSPDDQFDESPTAYRGDFGDRRASRGGRVGGTVAAIAGALGVELRKSSYSNRTEDPRGIRSGNFASDGSPRPKMDSGVGYRSPNSLLSPIEPNVGSSPQRKSEMFHASTGNTIDRDNLNSRPARTQQLGPQMSGLGVTSIVTGSAPYTDQSASQLEPSTPKRSKREAAIYQSAEIPNIPNDEIHPSPPDLSRTVYQAVTKPNTYTIRSTSANRVLPWDDEPSESRTSSYPAIVPIRGSSLEPRQPTFLPLDIAQGPSMSRFSEYSTVTQFSTDSHPVWYADEGINRQQTSPPQQRTNMSETATMTRPANVNVTTPIAEQRPDTAKSSSTAKRQHLRIRSESEDYVNGLGRQNTDKSFESLINSGETLHYTLTPESARAAELPRTPKVKTQTQDLADFLRTTAPPGLDEPAAPNTKIAKVSQVPLQPSPSETSPRSRIALGQPRDPRTERSTIRDLADYARSTGPEVESQLPQALSPRPGTAPNTRPSPALKQDGLPKLVVGGMSANSTRPATAADKPSSRLKYQARDARPARTTESSDLIDFIREGPPRGVGEHRIDRHVAPFRSTQDSEDLMAIAPKIEASPRLDVSPRLDMNRRNSAGSAQDSSLAAKSMQESTDSRTALLDSTSRGGMRPVNGGSNRQIPEFGWQKPKDDHDQRPQRKRGKVRDPYAIDFSDEEFDDEPVLPPTKTREEESLIDFLRNTGPTPGAAAQPVVAAAPRQEESTGLNRTSSMSKFKDLVSRDTPNSLRNGHGRRSSKVGAREESPHLTQVGSKLDKYRPTQATHAAHVERNRQKPRNDVRDTTRNGDTTDLADFLRNTEPPDSTLAKEPKYVASNVKEQAGFLKFFAKRGSVRR